MSLSLISNAYAEGAAPAQDGLGGLVFPAVLLVAFVLMIWSQQKRSKQQKSMVEALQKGDEIITVGGELARVEKVGTNYLSVEIAENVVVQIQKSAVQSVLPKGTIKSAN